jgi:hypothetical protein
MVPPNYLIEPPVTHRLSRPSRPSRKYQGLSSLRGSIGMRGGLHLTNFVLVRSIGRHLLVRSENGSNW